MIDKKKRVDKILKDIKSIKIQGASNIAKKALLAYRLIPTKATKRRLSSSRPTEPMMIKVLELAERNKNYSEILKHFEEAQEKINQKVLRLIKDKDVILTHCHSTNVIKALIYAKERGKKFEVYNTETRPLFQGKKTSKELMAAGIKVTMFIDSSVGVVLSGEQGDKKPDKVFLGADAILKKSVINKIGSGAIAKLAKQENVPVYIIADSWKKTNKKIPIEQRKLDEIWKNAPKKIRIKNYAFGVVDKKYITEIISD
jgi:ribose 1,5-bisphosphate isomerase